VLDSSIGKPAAGVRVDLHVHKTSGNATTEIQVWEFLASGVTNADGRCVDLLSPGDQQPVQSARLQSGGLYKIVFETKDYFDRAGKPTFYPWVEISFAVVNPDEHYHIPLLISPFSYTTYRGS
jgi:5-hydroxyisourate hydrolase